VIFNEIQLIYKKFKTSDSSELVRDDDLMKNVNLIDLLQLMRMRNINLHQSNVESNQSIKVLDQVIKSMTLISKNKNDENVVLVFENQNQDSFASAENLMN
jgi:hypothetical protein